MSGTLAAHARRARHLVRAARRDEDRRGLGRVHSPRWRVVVFAPLSRRGLREIRRERHEAGSANSRLERGVTATFTRDAGTGTETRVAANRLVSGTDDIAAIASF